MMLLLSHCVPLSIDLIDLPFVCAGTFHWRPFDDDSTVKRIPYLNEPISHGAHKVAYLFVSRADDPTGFGQSQHFVVVCCAKMTKKIRQRTSGIDVHSGACAISA